MTTLEYALLVSAGLCAGRSLAILWFRKPARAGLIYDDFKRSARARDAAVFLSERAPMPNTVQDLVAFTTADGEEIRVTKRRLAVPLSSPILVWYLPSNPKSIAIMGPLAWLGWTLAMLGSFAWLRWG